MSSVKMIKLEDGNYVPEECYTFGRNFETGEMEVDDVSLPCGGDCSCGGTFEDSCKNCVIQRVMNEYAEQKENGWIPVNTKMPKERIRHKISDRVLVTIKFNNRLRVSTAYTQDGEWVPEPGWDWGKVIAWKEFPEPYKESKKGERDVQRKS